MSKQTPLVQAIVGALVALLALGSLQLLTGTRHGDPLVYLFIAVVAISGFFLTLIRAEATQNPDKYQGRAEFLRSYFFLGLLFVVLLAYAYFFNLLIMGEPSRAGFFSGLPLATILVILHYRRSRKLSDSFWKMLGITGSVVVASAVLLWAVRHFV